MGRLYLTICLPKGACFCILNTAVVTRTLGRTTGIAVLGALWAGQVFEHAGEVLTGGATVMPIPAQVFALRDTFLIVSVLIFAPLLLSIWGLREERMTKKKQITTISGSEDAA